MQSSGLGINQYDVLPDRVVVYLWPYAGGAKFDFKFRPRFGLNAKSAALGSLRLLQSRSARRRATRHIQSQRIVATKRHKKHKRRSG